MIYGILFFCTAVSCFSLLCFRKGGASCVIIRTADTEYRYSLSDERSIPIESNGIRLTVVIENGCVSVADSDCRDRWCIRTGSISQNGQSIVCLPAETVITIAGEKEADGNADFILG